MFESLPKEFNEYGLNADVRTLLLLRKSMDKGLVNTMGDMFQVLKAIVVKDPKMIGPYSRAFYNYFLRINIRPGERLDEALIRSDSFKEWLMNNGKDIAELSGEELQDLINKYLDQVHMTTFDIKRILSGKDILDKDDPDLKDKDGNGGRAPSERTLDKAADYRDIDMQELLDRMERVRKQQNMEHFGGSHWLGQGGISPYGNGGAAFGGIRVGGSGGGKMARKVIDDPRYYPVDLNQQINDDNIDAALASLKGIEEESAIKYLDVEKTIKDGLKQGGLFLPFERDKIEEKIQVILLIDNGGYSMDPYIWTVMEIFKKMKTRFAHDLEVYYFHNTIYEKVFSDDKRTKAVKIEKILNKDPSYRVFVVGDAAMAPYELSQYSMMSWMALKNKFKRMAWLNPIYKKHWNFTPTIHVLGKIFPMYELTPKGIDYAVRNMNKKKKDRR